MRFSFFTALFLIVVITACKKEDAAPPAISLKSGAAYTADGSVVAIGGKIRFGIVARSEDANITNLVISKVLTDGTAIPVLDTGMNTSYLDVNKTFYQNIEDTVKWTFTIMNMDRQFASTSLIIYKDPNSTFGGIYEYPWITVGYQGNDSVGHFIDPATGKVYFGDSAFLLQPLIDILCYFYEDENLPSPTFSSPGETSNGAALYYPELNNWSTKNYTKWDISVDDDPIPTYVFDACHNDSLLIVSYDDVWGKRKFKWADPGEVIPFLTSTGKKGLIKVLNTDHSETGTIAFSLKIQR